jgi:hypothetical protein
MDADLLALMPGAEEVVEWFGHWPDFHDAEVLSVQLSRDEESSLVVQASLYSQLDDSGRFTPTRTAVVTFAMNEISDISLEDFSSQNVIASLSLETAPEGWKVIVSPIYGLGGWIECKVLRVHLRRV